MDKPQINVAKDNEPIIVVQIDLSDGETFFVETRPDAILSAEIVSGTNWSVSANVIEFFGVKGTKAQSGKFWAINAFGDDLWFEVAPASIMSQILDCIEQDVATGSSDKIAQVQIGPCQAVVFFLEGKLTVDHLKKATEPEGLGFIDIPDVTVDDRVVTIRIIAEATYTVATADSDGNVL